MFTPKFTVIGDSLVDIAVGPLEAIPVPGTDVEVSSVVQGPGGSALNTAWHLAAQGVDTQLRSPVGKDRLGKLIMHSLATESKVRDSTSTIIETEAATASCITMFGARMERTFMSTYGAVKSATCEALVPESANLENNATHVHIGGFYTCKKLQAGLPALVKKLKAAGVKVSMDPNFDATAQWTPKAIIDLLTGEGAVDLVMPSEVEACEITSKETAAEALEALLEGGVGLVVIKRGANGVLAGSGSERWEVPACTVNKVVDTNGAGDAFNAGFLRAYSEGHSIKLALQAGCASAALAVQYVGAVGMWAAGRAEVDARCETEYSDKPWWQKGIMACMAPRKM